jgi:hypothetical protein
MKNETNDELKISPDRKIYQQGQTKSKMLEAFTLGVTPMILIVSNIAIALGTAGFVAWLLHHMPYAFPKMALFSVVGAVAAIYIPSRASFSFQIIGLMRRLPIYAKQADLSPQFVKWTKQKMRFNIWLNLLLVIVGLALVVSVHGTLIMIMITAFSDPVLMKDLGIQGGEFAYIVLGIGMEVASALVDLFLGLNTRVRVSVDDFVPDLNEVDDLLQKKEEYAILERRIAKLKKQEEKKKEQKGPNDKNNNQNSGGSNNRGNNSRNNQNQTAWELDKPSEKLVNISGYNRNEDILKVAFKGTTFNPEQFEAALGNVSDTQRRKRISKSIVREVNKLKNLYTQGSDESKWTQQGDVIWRDIQESIKKLVHISDSMGYKIDKK